MNPRTLLFAGAATLAVGLTGVVFAISRGGGVLALRPVPAAEPDGPAAPPAPATAVPAVAPEPAPEPPRITPAAIRARPSARSDVSWREVPIAVRLSDLGPALAAPVKRGLDEARGRMEPCFEAEARELAASRRPPPEPDVGGPAVLILSLESRPGGLDLVDTELESLGTSTRGLVRCCREALRGWTFDVPEAPAARRYRLKLPLQ